MLLGEANVVPGEAQKYFGDGDGLHMMFNFWVNQHLFSRSPPATRGRSRSALRQTADASARARSGRSSSATTTSSISAG